MQAGPPPPSCGCLLCAAVGQRPAAVHLPPCTASGIVWACCCTTFAAHLNAALFATQPTVATHSHSLTACMLPPLGLRSQAAALRKLGLTLAVDSNAQLAGAQLLATVAAAERERAASASDAPLGEWEVMRVKDIDAGARGGHELSREGLLRAHTEGTPWQPPCPRGPPAAAWGNQSWPALDSLTFSGPGGGANGVRCGRLERRGAPAAGAHACWAAGAAAGGLRGGLPEGVRQNVRAGCICSVLGC